MEKRETNSDHDMEKKIIDSKQTEAEFTEFEPRLKYGWFHLKLYLFFKI